MKRFLLGVAACLLALLVTEGLVRFVIGYPTYGVKARAYGLWSSGASQPLFSPRSRYWTVEGGNKVYARNNLGFPGRDVDPSGLDSCVFVVGDSYVQGYEVLPDSMATSVLQGLIERHGRRAAVLNLGRGGTDPYDCYFRTLFFESRYAPAAVLLVLQGDYAAWFARHPGPLAFTPDPRSGREDRRAAVRLHNAVRNASAFANLLIKAAYENQQSADQNGASRTPPADASPTLARGLAVPADPGHEEAGRDSGVPDAAPDGLLDCLKAFRSRFGRRFVCVSIIDDKEMNERLAAFAGANRIGFVSRPLNRPEFKIRGTGHLDARGHRLLGELLYEAFAGNPASSGDPAVR